MTFWSGKVLSVRLPALISDYSSKRIDCAAYTLRMGGQYYVSAADESPNESKLKKLSVGDSLVVPPGQFAVLLTKETVTVPFDAISFISIKTSLKARGLVNVSGFHVDPGYSAPLRFSVFNAGPSPIYIRQDDECFLIWYANLEEADRQFAKSSAQNTVYQRGISGSDISSIAGPVRTIDVLSKKVEEIEKQQRRVNLILAIAGSVIIVAIPILLWLIQMGLEYLPTGSSDV